MLFPSFPFHPSGPFYSSSCSWLLGWTPSLPASVSFLSVVRLLPLRIHRNAFFNYSCSRQRCSPPAWLMPSQSSCQTNGCWWLCRPAWSSTSWACRASPGYVSAPQFSSDESLFTLSKHVCVCVCVNRQGYTGWPSSTSLLLAGCCCFWRSWRSSASATYTVTTSRLEAMAARAAALMGSPHASAGGNRFIQDIEMMLGKKSWVFWLWWRACWFCISPAIIVVSKASVTLTGFCAFSCFIREKERTKSQ